MTIEEFEILKQKLGITPYQISKYTGISESTFSKSKERGSKLSKLAVTKIKECFDYYAVLIEKTSYFESAWWTGDISITVQDAETKIWDKSSKAFKNKQPSVLIRFETPPQYQDVLPFILAFKKMF